MALPAQFTGNVSPTGEELDANFAALGRLAPVPCGTSGANEVTLTPLSNSPNIAAYSNYLQFSAIASATNTGPMTVQVGSLPALGVYKSTIAGPVLLGGGEVVLNTPFLLMYDTSLGTGAGGFYLLSPPSLFTETHNGFGTLTFGAMPPNTGSVATIALSGTSVGDIVNIGFPSSPSIGIAWTGYVPNAGTVAISAFNTFWTIATVTPPSGVYRVSAARFT